jgi:hypothetical protein
MAKEPKNLDDLFHDTLKDIKENIGDFAEDGESGAE